MPATPRPLKTAVIGAGLAGLSAAWLLARGGRHEVTLFERQPQPGFTAASVTVPGPGGVQRVDVPLRVFYPGYYPTLTRLYRALGVDSEPVSYAATFHGNPDPGDDRGGARSGRPYFRYRNLRWGSRSLGVLAPQDLLLGARARGIVGGILRFHRRALPALARGDLEGLTVGDFAARQGLGRDFVDGFLLPAIATVCTCTHAQARSFPATVIADYLARGLSSQAVRRAVRGADDVQQRLLAGIPRLLCNARIAGVRREGGGVTLALADGSTLAFDQVVFATPAKAALALLADATAAERQALQGFGCATVEVVTHTDASLLPPRRGDWSPVNLWVSAAHEAPMSTIWINAVQPALRGGADVFQTVHPLREPRADLVLGRARFERPLVDGRSQQALRELQALHDEPGRRVWFCGSYAQAGIPLLESAARSALAVAQRFGAELP